LWDLGSEECEAQVQRCYLYTLGHICMLLSPHCPYSVRRHSPSPEGHSTRVTATMRSPRNRRTTTPSVLRLLRPLRPRTRPFPPCQRRPRPRPVQRLSQPSLLSSAVPIPSPHMRWRSIPSSSPSPDPEPSSLRPRTRVRRSSRSSGDPLPLSSRSRGIRSTQRWNTRSTGMYPPSPRT
jgi:hypothetical protein